MVSVGKKAPDATLKFTSASEFGEIFELKDAYQSGTTVLYFFPAAFSEVCTETNCELNDDLEEFSNLDANIFGISTDLHYSHKQFIELHKLKYPLLSDFNKEAITAFDVVDNNYDDFFEGVAKRSIFVIKSGKLIYKWQSDDPWVYPPFDEIKEVLHS